MKRAKNRLAFALSLVMLTGMITGCQGNNTASGSAPANSSASTGASAAASGAVNTEEKKLTVYTPASQELINMVVKGFEEKTGIKVDVVAAGMGELMKRIDAEKSNPLGDVIWGGSPSMLIPKENLLQEYISPNESSQMDGHKNSDKCLTHFSSTPSVIIVNKNLIGDINVEGYADLLNPKLKGKIAHADPASSGSAYNHVINMLYAMGKNGDPGSQDGWDYINKLIKNLEGKVVSSSSGVYKGVSDGEYTVGLTYEDPAITLLKNGAPVKVVFPKEGAIFKDSVIALLKNCKHPNNAKTFIDYCTSEEVQNKLGTQLSNRPVRQGATVAEYLTPIDKIKTITEDVMWPVKNKTKVVEKYEDLFTSAKG